MKRVQKNNKINVEIKENIFKDTLIPHFIPQLKNQTSSQTVKHTDRQESHAIITRRLNLKLLHKK